MTQLADPPSATRRASDILYYSLKNCNRAHKSCRRFCVRLTRRQCYRFSHGYTHRRLCRVQCKLHAARPRRRSMYICGSDKCATAGAAPAPFKPKQQIQPGSKLSSNEVCRPTINNSFNPNLDTANNCGTCDPSRSKIYTANIKCINAKGALTTLGSIIGSPINIV